VYAGMQVHASVARLAFRQLFSQTFAQLSRVFGHFFGENIFKIITSVPRREHEATAQRVVSHPAKPILSTVCVFYWFFSFSPFVTQGCQMVYFQNKNPSLGKYWRAVDRKMLKNFMAIVNILRTLAIFYDHFVHFVLIWYIVSGHGIMYQEKSGNPVATM
jgi:coproporphyrinogen III oxidase